MRFSLIEFLIVLSILGILAAVAYPVMTGKIPKSFKGSTPTVQCIEGYKFVVDRISRNQIINEQGHGISCN